MIIRSKAPLRISLAGGGTDLAEYSDLHGGAILNATIDKHAYATITPLSEGIVLRSIDQGMVAKFETVSKLSPDGEFDLVKGVYNRIVKDFNHNAPLSFELTTFVDAPVGSGLGSSSTLVVAIIGAFTRWLNLPLDEYDIAQLAYDVERIDLGFAGGRQDQYAATFGGWNFMEFHPHSKVIVNPLRIRPDFLRELEYNIVLYYTGTSRLSSAIIAGQIENLEMKSEQSLEGMHRLKEQAYMMKESLLTGELSRMGNILDFGWTFKKDTASGISNPEIDRIYDAARAAGALGGKISGAGGGGYMTFYCPGNTRYTVIDVLESFGGQIHPCQFSHEGVTTWEAD